MNDTLAALIHDDTLAAARVEISQLSFGDEQQAVERLLEDIAPLEPLRGEINELAHEFVRNMREKGGGTGVEAFLHEYGLKSEEGVAIMCLAEALLRIPDRDTADALIEGTFNQANWKQHLGKSHSLFVNASSWGLLLTGKVMSLKGENPLGIVGKAVGRLGEPVIRQSLKMAMRVIGKQFVLGEDIEDALDEARDYYKNGYFTSFDILGEGARTDAQAEQYMHSYLKAIDDIAGANNKLKPDSYNLSIKLSALHPRLHLAKQAQLEQELMPRLVRIIEKARDKDIRITLDAEEAARLDISLEILTTLLDHPCAKGFNGVGFVVQAYQKRAPYVIDYLAELAKRTHRVIPVRLVKGAYWDSEIKWAQTEGLPNYPVFTHKEYTDVSFLSCTVRMMERSQYFYPQFATHNARTVASVISLAKHFELDKEDFEFQRLHGMGESLHNQLTGRYRCRIYGPVGRHRDLLAYLIRRLMENGANSSFVNLIMDQHTPAKQLLANPVRRAKANECKPNPYIPLPIDIYGERWRNSLGLDIAYLEHHDELEQTLKTFDETTWRAGEKSLQSRRMFEPADLEKYVGEVVEMDAAAVNDAMQTAKKQFASWRKQPVEERAAILNNTANAIEEHSVELISMCMREAGKTWHDAVAEIREAADFCRFYAYQASLLFSDDVRPGPTGESNVLSLHPRGVIGCISPWNFPLAIFMGQVAAALVTGNCVLAKPAPQTPLIAQKALELFEMAGLPKGTLQLLLGGGEIGGALVSHPDIAGIVFTGSVPTAKRIQRTLAEKSGPIIPLIAETGGLNCMVVDSSALLEQACDDIILSAFGSAGQRCSALRMLYVQEDIADDLYEMLSGAMEKLRIAHPRHFDTDIGPVIDSAAKQKLNDHIESLHQSATFIASTSIDPNIQQQGHFVVPHAFELADDSQLTEEFFGPILHIVRFKHSELRGLAERINRKGYGLTFGIHSRIKDHIEYFTKHIHVGNIYVNRSMTGAVVGVQPFGGEGLSGTGPKAGGTHYLQQLVTERHTSINTTAIGGNLQLLSQV